MRNCGPGWSIEPEVQRAADARREGERMNRAETIESLKYILSGPSLEDGGFDPKTVEIAGSALDIIERDTVPASALAELREAIARRDAAKRAYDAWYDSRHQVYPVPFPTNDVVAGEGRLRGEIGEAERGIIDAARAVCSGEPPAKEDNAKVR